MTPGRSPVQKNFGCLPGTVATWTKGHARVTGCRVKVRNTPCTNALAHSPCLFPLPKWWSP